MNQSAFSDALLHPTAEIPAGMQDPQGRPAPKRFSVYRNNVAVGLRSALEDGFPVVRALVGDAFFGALATVYYRQFPPSSPLLMLYGATFADFLAGFEPVAHLKYLPDVARLEYGLRESYHAADAPAVPKDQLTALSGGDLLSLRLRLAPSLRIVRSDWPIVSIWAANTRNAAPPTMTPEAALILRSGFDPEPYPIRKADAEFLDAVRRGRTLGEALECAPDADAGGLVGLLLSQNSVTEIFR